MGVNPAQQLSLSKVSVPSHALLSGPCHISRPDVKGAGKGRLCWASVARLGTT